MDPAARCRRKPAFAMYSLAAMCAPDRSSGSVTAIGEKAVVGAGLPAALNAVALPSALK